MNSKVKNNPLVLLVLALLLAACAGQPAQTSVPPADTPVPNVPDPTATTAMAEAPAETMPVAEETLEPSPEATVAGAPTEQVPSTGGPLVYKIVPGESQVSYEVGETFFDDNRFNTAIGVTSEINGEVQIDTANPQNSSLGTFTVDISQLRSDSSRRDNAIRERFLQSAQYPIATFVPTQVEGLPATYTPGQEITFQVTGDLTIRETTLPATFDVTANLDGETLTGTAATTILMSEFGFGPIELFGTLGTEDEVKITFNFVARPE